jgi:hypothetical protein
MRSRHHQPLRIEFTAGQVCLALLLVIGFGSLPGAVAAQDTVTIRGAPQCETCRIRARLVTRLGSLGDDNGPARYVWLARDSRGRYLVSPAASEDRVLIYGSNGRLQGELGRRGEGPGEFKVPGFVQVNADTIAVYDRIDGARSLFTSDGTFIPRDPTGLRIDNAVVTTQGQLLVQGRAATVSAIGLPAHRVNLGGAPKSFGADEQLVDPRVEMTWLRHMGPARGEAVWLGHILTYVAERWSASGQRELTVRRDVPWFPPGDVERGATSVQYVRPRPMLIGLWEDEDQLLWMVTRVAG